MCSSMDTEAFLLPPAGFPPAGLVCSDFVCFWPGTESVTTFAKYQTPRAKAKIVAATGRINRAGAVGRLPFEITFRRCEAVACTPLDSPECNPPGFPGKYDRPRFPKLR